MSIWSSSNLLGLPRTQLEFSWRYLDPVSFRHYSQYNWFDKRKNLDFLDRCVNNGRSLPCMDLFHAGNYTNFTFKMLTWPRIISARKKPLSSTTRWMLLHWMRHPHTTSCLHLTNQLHNSGEKHGRSQNPTAYLTAPPKSAQRKHLTNCNGPNYYLYSSSYSRTLCDAGWTCGKLYNLNIPSKVQNNTRDCSTLHCRINLITPRMISFDSHSLSNFVQSNSNTKGKYGLLEAQTWIPSRWTLQNFASFAFSHSCARWNLAVHSM